MPEHLRSWSPRTSTASFDHATSVSHFQNGLVLENVHTCITAVAASQPDAAKIPGFAFFFCVRQPYAQVVDGPDCSSRQASFVTTTAPPDVSTLYKCTTRNVQPKCLPRLFVCELTGVEVLWCDMVRFDNVVP